MFKGPARTLVLSAALAVSGAIVGVPSVLTEFPLNLILLAMPLALCTAIPTLHQTRTVQPSVAMILTEVASVWVGYAAAFHQYHGFWDGQGFGIGLIGFLASAPLVIALMRRHVGIPTARKVR